MSAVRERCEIDVVFVGQTGVGKSSLINMIMDAPDGASFGARVSNDAHPCTMHTTCYSTSLDTDSQCRLWDTRGLDEAAGSQNSFMTKIVDRIRQLSSQQARELRETLRDRSRLATPILMWCIDAAKVDIPFHWQQLRRIFVDYGERKAVPVVVITRGPPKAVEWKARCTDQLRQLDMGVDVRLIMVRRYRNSFSPEYREDSQALRALILELMTR